MKYWNQILENLSKDQRNEKFQIILNGTTYEIPLSYALGISSLITEKYFNDPSFHELKIKINEDNQMGDKEIQNEFQKFIHGEEISNEFYFAIGSSLENKEMIQNWSQNQTKTTKTIMNMINANHKINNQGIENIKELLSYLPDHLEELKENLNELRNDELIFILKSDKIKVEKEDIIWEIVKERLLKIENSNNQENKSLLLGTIEPKYLRKDYLKEYIEMIDNEDIEREAKLFKKIKQLLIQNIDNIKIKKEIKGKIEKINHEEGQNFQGILYNLQKKYGNNIHDQGIISISASSSQHNRPEIKSPETKPPIIKSTKSIIPTIPYPPRSSWMLGNQQGTIQQGTIQQGTIQQGTKINWGVRQGTFSGWANQQGTNQQETNQQGTNHFSRMNSIYNH